MINQILLLNEKHAEIGLCIVDARSYMAANGNRAVGGGYENTEFYK